MKLYNFDHSPNPLKVRMALAELEIDHELKEVILFKREQRHESFLKVNPLGKVPVLVDKDITLRESNAILCYLAKEYGRYLWPSNPRQESIAMQWLFFESAHMAPSFGTIWFNKFGLPKIGFQAKSLSELGDAVEDVEWALGHLETHLKENQYVLGRDFSLVDCAIGVQIAALKETVLSDSNWWPHVQSYMQRIISRPSWNKARGKAIWDN